MSKKRKSKKKPKSNFVAKDDSEATGINFFAFLIGLVTTLMVILLVWSQWSTLPGTANILAATSDIDRAADAVGRLDSEDFDRFLNSGSAEHLSNVLISFDQSNENQRSVAEQVADNRRRIEICNQMLNMQLSPNQRELAIISQIDAMTSIYNLDLHHQLKGPKITKNLRETAEKHKKDQNSDIKLAARLALFKLNSIAVAESKREKVSPLIIDEFEKLNKDFPNNRMVLAAIQLAVNKYMETLDPGASSAFVDSLRERIDVSNSPELAAAFDEFSDMAILAQSGLNEAFTDRWVNGKEGQTELHQASLKLAANPAAGPVVIGKINQIATWLEQIDEYQMAEQIYQKMLDRADDIKMRAASTLARQASENGLRRIRLVGNKLNIAGTKPNGDPINASDFEDKIVVVVFWSVDHPASVDALQQLVEERKVASNPVVQILAVCTEKTFGKESEWEGVMLDEFQIVVPNDKKNGEVPILDQCPSSDLPRAMLVGRDGMVVDINVPMSELNTQIDFLYHENRKPQN